jgi:GNAT superfamily N-acetyltransferase
VIVRQATPEDHARLAALAGASPDGGAVGFRPEHHVPPGEITRGHERSEHFVAEIDGALAGTARLDLGTCRFEGDDTRYALLSSLQVDPAYRESGAAALLTDTRLARATELSGEDAVTLAYVQAASAESLANAHPWATQVLGRLVVTPVPVRQRAPRSKPGLTVRPAAPGELAEIAAAVDAWSAGHDFARRWDAARLGDWLAASPLPDPVNHYRVVSDESGRLLAGLGIHERGRLTSLVIDRLPLFMRAANTVLHTVPRDGRMRNLIIDKMWFAPGRLDAARSLWETVRWEWRAAGGSLLLNHDPRDPVHRVIAARPWLPTTTSTVALRSRRPMHPETIVEQL